MSPGFLKSLFRPETPKPVCYPSAKAAQILNSPRSVMVLSIPKSGTHWMCFLLLNYARQLRDSSAGPIDYKELKQTVCERDVAMFKGAGFRPPLPFLPEHGYDHLLFQHVYRDGLQDHAWNHLGKKICLVRNPLDYLVSAYFYYYKFRGEPAPGNSPAALGNRFIPRYAEGVRFVKEQVIPAGGATLVHYEELKKDAVGTLEKIIGFLGLPLDRKALEAAVQLSDAKKVAAMEKEFGRALVAPLKEGSFVRDGSVGQWKSCFSDREVARIETLLNAQGLKLADFHLE
jgi:hypothetical protein